MKLRKEFINISSSKRLYNLPKPIIGLTGSIATGKSSLSVKLKREYGIEIICADELVKEIYQCQSTVEFIKTISDKVVVENKINFQILRQLFFNDQHIKIKIENFIYQLLPQFFLEKSFKIEQEFIIYDIPLLFEKKLKDSFDYTILAYCTPETQLKRLIKRDNIETELAKNIIGQQYSIDDKRMHSDLIFDNTNDNLNVNFKVFQKSFDLLFEN
jgi:dephospho-CoA kinase